jgi:acyl-CoA thioesterase-2
MAASFQRPTAGIDRQVEPSPTAGDPEVLPVSEVPLLVSVDCRIAPGAPTSVPGPDLLLASRYWARCTVPLPDDPLVHAAVLTYVSDWSSGLVAVHEGPWVSSPSLDHAIWLHRPLRLDDWVLIDLVPHTVAAGRGFYTGSVHARTGELGATIAQEALYGRLKEKK